MNTKLTLRLDENLIAQAKAYAAKEGRSVSELVGAYFVRLADGKKTVQTTASSLDDAQEGPLAPRRSSFYGVMAGSSLDEADYYAYLEQKHK